MAKIIYLKIKDDDTLKSFREFISELKSDETILLEQVLNEDVIIILEHQWKGGNRKWRSYPSNDHDKITHDEIITGLHFHNTNNHSEFFNPENGNIYQGRKKVGSLSKSQLKNLHRDLRGIGLSF